MSDTNETIRALERRIEQLEKVPHRAVLENSVDLAALRKRVDGLFDLLRSQKEWLDSEFLLIEDTRRKADILADAYYRLLPERYAEDFKVAERFDASLSEDVDVKS